MDTRSELSIRLFPFQMHVFVVKPNAKRIHWDDRTVSWYGANVIIRFTIAACHCG